MELADRKKEEIPSGWGVDATGKVTCSLFFQLTMLSHNSRENGLQYAVYILIFSCVL